MEGSESGALVPSDTSLEVETWVKLCNFPAEFLTADALSMIGSSFGSPVMMDEDTDEKVENHKWPPKLRRKLHSRKTFVRILVRVSVTKPLPSRVAVICPKGREYIIRLEFEPTPKVCLLCFGAGHFDFECCGTDKVSVVAEAGVGFVEVNGVAVEDVLGVDLQLGDCCDSMSDEVDGEQGAVTIDGVESFENSVVEAVLFPAATCDFDDAVVGELGADHAIVDGLLEQSLVERTVVALEVQPLLPATIAADGSEGTIISDGFVCYEDPPVVEAVLEIENLECEIQEKQKQMKVLEQRMVESGEASVASASMVEMQQTITKLMAQCSEKGFELEITSADNRVLQEQLQNKCTENKELEEKVLQLEQQLTSVSSDNKPSSSENCVHDEYTEELRKKVQLQEIENEKLKLERVQILEENSGLHVQNQKLAEEAAYAKELASAAAVELKNLAGEVTKLSLQNAKLEKEMLAARELSTRSSSSHGANGGNRKHNDQRTNRRGRVSGRANEVPGMVNDDFDMWNLDPDDIKMELQARKQREAVLEAALAEKEIMEDEYRKKVEEAKKREKSLENDLANMWVLVARLKKEATVLQESKVNVTQNGDTYQVTDPKVDGSCKDPAVRDRQALDHSIAGSVVTKEEPLVVRLKARMQEMKEKELRHTGNGDANSHVCKVCFESPTAAMLLPCRHFCLCKSCSLACSECPICRTNIADRIFAFT